MPSNHTEGKEGKRTDGDADYSSDPLLAHVRAPMQVDWIVSSMGHTVKMADTASEESRYASVCLHKPKPQGLAIDPFLVEEA